MIDELTAQKYMDGLDEAASEDRKRMERELLAYADEIERAEKEEEEQHFERVFTDPAYFESLSGSDEIERAENTSLSPSDVRYGAANRAFLSYRLGREVRGVEYDSDRNGYAKANFGKPEVGEKEFFDLVKGQFEWQQKKKLALNELNTSAVKQALDSALSGERTSLVDTFSKWKEKNIELVDEEQDADTLQQSMRVLAQAGDDLQAVAPIAAKVYDSLTKFAKGEADEGDLQAIGAELARMPVDQRKKAYRYAILASQASGDFDLNELEQFAKNLGQATARGFGFLEGPMRFRNVGGLVSIPVMAYNPINLIEQGARVRRMQLERKPDSPEKTIELERLSQAEEMTKVVRELRDVAKNGIDPIKPITPEGKFISWATAERGIYGLAGSIGYMAAAGINPVLGTLAIAGDEYEQMRLNNPDMDPNVAGAASLASGAIQGFIERLQIRTLTGTLPLTGRFLADMKAGIVAKATKLGAGIAEQNLQEGLQDAVSDGIPALLSHIRDDMPDANVDEIMKDYVKERGEVFFAVLPLGLIGGGAATIRDFRDAGLSDKELRQAGFSKTQRDTILLSNDPDTAIRSEAPKRTQANIQAGIKEINRDLGEAEKLQRDPDMPTLESVTLSDGSREYQVVRPAPAQQTEVRAEQELAGQIVTLSATDPATGEITQYEMDADEAHSLVQRNVRSYGAVIDCLSK